MLHAAKARGHQRCLNTEKGNGLPNFDPRLSSAFEPQLEQCVCRAVRYLCFRVSTYMPPDSSPLSVHHYSWRGYSILECTILKGIKRRNNNHFRCD